MAVTRRGYIFSAFLSSVLSVLLIAVSFASDSWIVSTVNADVLVRESSLEYGLFRGDLELYILDTPTSNTVHVVCLAGENACAVSCKTTREAREDEVRLLANGRRPNPTCVASTFEESGVPLDPPPVISFAFYVCLLLIICFQLIFAVISAGLAITNATTNPTEPVFGLPGCLWANVIAAVLGLTVLMMFGIYWATSGLRDHVGLAYAALGQFHIEPSLGFSYWLLIAAIVCSLVNVGLIQTRKYILERNPEQPSGVKVDPNADGTIFLY